jgi:hypothetical protein
MQSADQRNLPTFTMANRSYLTLAVAALILAACRDATPRPGIPTPLPDAPTAAPTAAAALTEAAPPEAAPDVAPTAIDPASLAPQAVLPAVVKIDPAGLGIPVASITVPGVDDPPGTPFVEAGLPAHVRLAFGASKPDTGRVDPRQPQILIIPLGGYLQKFGQMPELQEEVKAQVDELRALLRERSITDAETITVLPPFNAAQLVHSRISYLDLPGAKGVRFLTAYATDPTPITSEDLFYTFQGVTNDGAYYISAFFPLESTTLTKARADVSTTEADEAENRFGDYLVRIAGQLEAAGDADFSPSLDKLDAVIRSIEPLATAPGASAPTVPPAVTAEATATAATATSEPTMPVIATATATSEPIAEATATSAPTAEATLEPAATETAEPESTATARPPALQVGRTTTVVNLRSAASTRARIIMEVPRNTAVTVLGRTANSTWLRVRLRNGRVGWMSAAYVRNVNLRRLPVVR